MILFQTILKMGGCNSFEAPNIYPDLNDEHFTLNQRKRINE